MDNVSDNFIKNVYNSGATLFERVGIEFFIKPLTKNVDDQYNNEFDQY